MAHEIDSMFSVGQRPWHGLGHVLGDVPGVKEAIVLAGLAWPVELRPVVTTVTLGGVSVPIETHRAVMRMDTGRVLGVVGEGFTPLQNEEAFGFFAPLIDEGLITLETAGSLREGRRVWVMARVAGDPEEVAGDVIERYALLCHGHDGSLALRVGFNPVRVVCANTLSLALESTDGMVSIRHTAGMTAALERMRTVIGHQCRIFGDTAEQWRHLAARTCSDAQFTAYALRVAAVSRGMSDDDVRESMPSPALGKRLLEALRPLYEGGKGNDRTGVRGTWWAAYNAITQWLTHDRGRNSGPVREQAERRFEALHLGEARRLSLRALLLALEGAEQSGPADLPPLPVLADMSDEPLPEVVDIGDVIGG